MPALFALVNSLTPDDVGARVVVRRALPEGGQGDVLGELVSWSGEVLTVRTRGGELVPISAGAVLAGKRVPPPPVRRAPRGAAGELVEVAARGWPGVEEEWLGRWWLRAAGGFTGRANAVHPLADPDRPLDEALAAVREWYAARGLPALVQVEQGSELDRQLADRGWAPAGSAQPGETVLVQTAPLESVLAALDGRPEPSSGPSVPVEVNTHPEPPEGWLRLYRGGVALPGRPLSTIAHQVLSRPEGAVRFVTAARDGAVVAGGRGVVLDGWLGIACLEVDEQQRRRGHGRTLIATLGRRARERGAGSAYLQVSAGNVGAVALYETLGFRTRYRYHYVQAR